MATTTQVQACAVHAVATEADFNTHISQLPASCLAVIYFHAPWAEPCKLMSTILDALASTYESGHPPRIDFLGLDAEEVPEVSELYDVTQVPLVVLQKDGQVIESITGTDAGKVRNAVEKHAGRPGVVPNGGAAFPPAQTVTPRANTKPAAAPSSTAPHANGAGHVPEQAPAQTGGAVAGANGTSKEELDARLAELVKAAPVMLFMKGTPQTPQCGFSRQTVGILREKGIRYGFFNILADDEVRQGLKEFSDWPTFPQLYVDGELVGGLDIVKEEFEDDSDFLKQYSVRA